MREEGFQGKKKEEKRTRVTKKNEGHLLRIFGALVETWGVWGGGDLSSLSVFLLAKLVPPHLSPLRERETNKRLRASDGASFWRAAGEEARGKKALREKRIGEQQQANFDSTLTKPSNAPRALFPPALSITFETPPGVPEQQARPLDCGESEWTA